MKIAIGCDHGGLGLKAAVSALLATLGHEVVNHGCDSPDSVDYPGFAQSVCEAVLAGRCARGILICGTGIGMSMAANRFKGIRAALCHELFTARMSREHNNANVLCLGARVIGPGLAEEMVRVWMTTEFAAGRHQRRIEMF
ncbi:MAG: ribose 5-phosphate isomerase B [Deltaproteobacteria bacterium RIFOXYD12_FULL_57_12]|nr:MAG: ribose 5-phosphate isomerase B [Deltaproteobacteria bacterium RIFOXYD12_FULL_57_12]